MLENFLDIWNWLLEFQDLYVLGLWVSSVGVQPNLAKLYVSPWFAYNDTIFSFFVYCCAEQHWGYFWFFEASVQKSVPLSLIFVNCAFNHIHSAFILLLILFSDISVSWSSILEKATSISFSTISSKTTQFTVMKFTEF